MFYITCALSIVMIAVLQLASPAIAAYYKAPELIAPLRVYSFSLLFSSFNSIQVARLQRAMRFREMMFCNLAATLVSGALGVFLAVRGAGLWALVLYFFAQIVATCAAMILVLRWLPKSPFSLDSAKASISHGFPRSRTVRRFRKSNQDRNIGKGKSGAVFPAGHG